MDEAGDIVARLILSPAIEFSHMKGDNIMDNIYAVHNLDPHRTIDQFMTVHRLFHFFLVNTPLH